MPTDAQVDAAAKAIASAEWSHVPSYIALYWQSKRLLARAALEAAEAEMWRGGNGRPKETRAEYMRRWRRGDGVKKRARGQQPEHIGGGAGG